MKNTEEQESPVRGFTLVEVLVAIVILAIVALGIMSLLPIGYRHVTSSGRISTINHLAQMKMDQLRSTSFTHLDLQEGLHPSTGAGETFPEMFSALSTNYEHYTAYWRVTDNVPRAGMKRVVLTVGYTQYDESGNPIASTDTKDQRIAFFTTYLTQ